MKKQRKCEKATLNVKNDRYGKCENISTLNVKSGRSGKCENNSTLNVKKSLVSWMTSQMVSVDNLVGLANFFGIFGFRGVNIPKVKNPGKCHDLERKCKMLIQEWAGGIFLGVYM